jgi:plastocyanin
MLITNIVLAALAQSLVVSAATMMVTVAANNRFQFTPNSITAQPGDMVAFNFISQNHSVASSNANSPCQPQQNAIFSDFQPIAAPGGNARGAGRNRGNRNKIRQVAAGNTPTFMVPIIDNQPIYIYCSQAQHCQKGMVMVINPPNAAAVQQYASKAAAVRNNVSPRGGVSGGTMLNNAAGTNPLNGVLGANAGDAATQQTGKGTASNNAAGTNRPNGVLGAIAGAAAGRGRVPNNAAGTTPPNGNAGNAASKQSGNGRVSNNAAGTNPPKTATIPAGKGTGKGGAGVSNAIPVGTGKAKSGAGGTGGTGAGAGASGATRDGKDKTSATSNGVLGAARGGKGKYRK